MMIKNKPIVSVIMATYNEPKHIIVKSINSILNQTIKDLELIIIDDSTSTYTIAAIDQIVKNDTRVVLIREKNRIEFVPALNLGLERAQGIFIARMDGDDVAHYNKLEQQIEFLEHNPQISIVGTAISIIDENDNITSKRIYPLIHSKIKNFAIFRNPFAHPTILMRREIVDSGYRYNENLKLSEDLDLWLRLLNNGYKFANIPSVLLDYRVVGDLADKRNKQQWKVSQYVRLYNFSWKYPIFSTLSVIVASIYTFIPNSIVRRIYHKENKKNII